MYKRIGALIKLPFTTVHKLYHAAVPYERRLIFWGFRNRQLQKIKAWRWDHSEAVRTYQAELRAILAQHAQVKGVVVFPPSVEWYTQLFQRPHQMAMAFAQLGYLVIYWSPPDSKDGIVGIKKVRERLYVCNVPGRAFRVLQNPVVISYTYNYGWARRVQTSAMVYELIDHLDIFSHFPRGTLLRSHRTLLRYAALVVGTANDLVAELKPQRPDAILCPNGVDVDHFAVATQETPDDMRPIVASGKPIIGYYGAMAEWFDFGLVKHAASVLPDYQFVLIGPDYDGLTIAKSGIEAFANIHWLGPKYYAELPAYLHAFDVATIPFLVTDALQAVSPIKLFEYMAGARPIVTTDLAECRKYPVAHIARTRDEWVEQLQEGVRLRTDSAYLAELRRVAQENTWQMRAQQIILALDAQHPTATAHARRADEMYSESPEVAR